MDKGGSACGGCGLVGGVPGARSLSHVSAKGTKILGNPVAFARGGWFGNSLHLKGKEDHRRRHNGLQTEGTFLDRSHLASIRSSQRA